MVIVSLVIWPACSECLLCASTQVRHVTLPHPKFFYGSLLPMEQSLTPRPSIQGPPRSSTTALSAMSTALSHTNLHVVLDPLPH